MFFKSYTKIVFLTIIPLVIFSGYFERYIFLHPQQFVESSALAFSSNNMNISVSGVSLPLFKEVPTTLIDKIKSISVDKNKVLRVKNYLARRNSPLAKKASYLVQAATYYKIDYRLVAAISIIESSGGIHTYRPYNAWGWGGAENAFTFRNWEEAITTVTRGLAGYYDRGADTPSEIAPSYNPHTPNDWARKVSSVMSQM